MQLITRNSGSRLRSYTMPKLTESELGYIAGILDGEGSIYVVHKRKYPVFGISINNTDKELIDWLHSKLLAGNMYTRKKEKAGFLGHKTQYQLMIIRKNEVYTILNTLLPFLRIKQYKALLVIAMIEDANGGNDV